MSVFLRYLASLMLHMAWQRTGNKGAVPPMRLPRRGPVNLPVIGPWQMMVAMWMLKRIWKRYGDDVRTRLMTHDNALANRVGAYLPTGAPDNATSVNATSATTASATPATVNIPASNSSSAAPAATPPAVTHDTTLLPTRRLPGAQNGAQAKPQGSLLSKLRGTS